MSRKWGKATPTAFRESRVERSAASAKGKRNLLSAAIRGAQLGNRSARAGTHGYKMASAYNISPGETKWYDSGVDAAFLLPSVNGTVATSMFDPPPQCLDAVEQGAGPTQRVGMKINYTGLSFKGSIFCAPRAIDQDLHYSCEVFLALVMDTQTNGAQMSAAMVYSNPSGTVTLNTHLHRNKAYEDRFKVLKTKRFKLVPGAAATGPWPLQPPGTAAIPDAGHPYIPMHTSGVVQAIDMYVNLKGYGAAFDPTVPQGTVNQHRDNSLHVICIVSNNDMEPRLSYNSRVTFTE